jgi:small nuclear ribonucleoprotein (snRNP)-like protein
MNDYPREDKKIVLNLSDNSTLSGLVNIVGRSTFAIVEDSDPDIVVYDASSGEGKAYKTVLVSKKQICWIDAVDDREQKPDRGKWQKVTFKLTNGQEITGEVNIAGFDRASDYFRVYPGRFYEVYTCSTANTRDNRLFVASEHVIWRELVV